jgi:hypothetical protein
METNRNSFHGFLLIVIMGAVASMATFAHAEQALPGDEILGFRVIDISATPEQHWHWHVKREVNYTYHPGHLPGLLLSLSGLRLHDYEDLLARQRSVTSDGCRSRLLFLTEDPISHPFTRPKVNPE